MFMPTLLPDGRHRSTKMDVKALFVTELND